MGAATIIGLGPFYEVQVQTDQAGTFRKKEISIKITIIFHST